MPRIKKPTVLEKLKTCCIADRLILDTATTSRGFRYKVGDLVKANLFGEEMQGVIVSFARYKDKYCVEEQVIINVESQPDFIGITRIKGIMVLAMEDICHV